MTAAFADVEDGLFGEAEGKVPPLHVDMVGVCHRCGAQTEPVRQDDVGRPWGASVAFALMALKDHNCPGPPPAQPGVHLRPANPNYALEETP